MGIIDIVGYTFLMGKPNHDIINGDIING